MPEMADHILDANILLPRGNEMPWGHVVAWCHVANGNVMGRVNAKPILDTRMCQVEFSEGYVTEVTTKVVAELIDTQCYADGNEYFVLDSLIDYCKDVKEIFLTEQQTSIQGRSVIHKSAAGWQICY